MVSTSYAVAQATVILKRTSILMVSTSYAVAQATVILKRTSILMVRLMRIRQIYIQRKGSKSSGLASFLTTYAYVPYHGFESLIREVHHHDLLFSLLQFCQFFHF